MAEWSIAAVLKTVDPKGSGGSNPSLSANVRFMKEKLTYAMIGGAEGSFSGAEGSFIGPVHRMAIRMDSLATLEAGAFSRDGRRNASTGRLLGLDPGRVYADWCDLLEFEKGKVDFISLCTPNSSHYAIAKAALEAGYDVMCEKPVSMTCAEADELVRIARARKRVVGVPFTYTGFPMVKLARDLVKSGELGRICKVVVEYQQGSFRKLASENARRTAWKMDPRLSGPSCVTADIGVHGFELLEYVTGNKVKAVLADLSSFVHSAGLDDDGSILMRLDGKAKASMVISKIATGEENGVRLRVYGDKASLFWNQEANNYLSVKQPFGTEQIYKRNAPYVAAISETSARLSRIPAGHHEGFIEAFANIYREFCAAVRDRKAHDFPGPREGVRTMRFVEAVLRSNKNGNRWEKI